ncbi:hypothetical protein G4228_014258 [Cervus hanglu yarkandensis]|nr:hypothetical protein G4228_014258 [Cervus hanglu yarkandensis]
MVWFISIFFGSEVAENCFFYCLFWLNSCVCLCVCLCVCVLCACMVYACWVCIPVCGGITLCISSKRKEVFTDLLKY